jgi:putative tryptophan/tyrosine transport system substrate-binding protein
MPNVIGILHSGTKGRHDPNIAAFTSAVTSAAGSNFTITNARYADDDPAKLANRLQGLIAQNVDVLVAAGGTACARAAAIATAGTAIKVVFTSVADATLGGLIPNPTAPGGNVTGICARTSELDADRLRNLAALPAPAALPTTTIGVLQNAARPNVDQHFADLQTVATGLGITNPLVQEKVTVQASPTPRQIDNAINAAFAAFAAVPVDAVLVAADSMFNDHRAAVLNTKQQIPAIYQWRDFVQDGGLMSFGTNLKLAYTLAGIYVGKILNGAAINTLPVLTMGGTELIVNLTAAYAFPLIQRPEALIANATEVIGGT